MARIMAPDLAGEQLAEFLQLHPKVMVLSGAGVSTDSGIPDYRDQKGEWKRRQPVQHKEFLDSEHVRKRYWARSLVGWPVVSRARPNPAHYHLADLESRTSLLVTQNVDRLHQKAGSERVVDLHGRADRVICMDCGFLCTRDEVHEWSGEQNPDYLGLSASTAPDGDADLAVDFSGFRIVNCPCCDGILKPDVVFFGDYVPKQRVDTALEALRKSDALLVVGSSLMVYSGYRFCRYAREWGKPIVTLNLGKTRADPIVDLKLNAPVSQSLARSLALLQSSAPA